MPDPSTCQADARGWGAQGHPRIQRKFRAMQPDQIAKAKAVARSSSYSESRICVPSIPDTCQRSPVSPVQGRSLSLVDTKSKDLPGLTRSTSAWGSHQEKGKQSHNLESLSQCGVGGHVSEWTVGHTHSLCPAVPASDSMLDGQALEAWSSRTGLLCSQRTRAVPY